MKKGNGGVWCK
jgi:hypothetical protein